MLVSYLYPYLNGAGPALYLSSSSINNSLTLIPVVSKIAIFDLKFSFSRLYGRPPIFS